MSNGKPCGRPDGHNGRHRSPEVLAQQAIYNAAWNATHVEHRKERDDKYNAAHKEERTAWYLANQEAVAAGQARRHSMMMQDPTGIPRMLRNVNTRIARRSKRKVV